MMRLKKRQTTDVAETDDRKRPRITKGKAHMTVELSTDQLSRTINTVTQTVLSYYQYGYTNCVVAASTNNIY